MLRSRAIPRLEDWRRPETERDPWIWLRLRCDILGREAESEGFNSSGYGRFQSSPPYASSGSEGWDTSASDEASSSVYEELSEPW